MMADELSPSSHGVFFKAFTTDSVIDMTWIETGVDGKQDFYHVGQSTRSLMIRVWEFG